MRWWRSWWVPLLGHALLFLGVYQLGYTPDEWAAIKLGAVERGISQKEAIREADGRFGFVKIYYLTDSDERLYREYARLTLDGEVDLPFVLGKKYMTQARPLPARPWPYRDVQVEYPPGMLLGTLPPAWLADSYRGYRFWLAAWMGAVYLLNVWLGVRVMWPQGAQADAGARGEVWGRALWWSLGFCALLGNLLVTRLDHLATLWILVCLWAAQRSLRGERGALGWAALAGVAAGLGAWTKVVPAVALGGPWMVYLWPSAGLGRRWGLWGASAAGLLASVVGLNLGSYALLGEGYWDTYTYHTDRGVQLESLWAGVILVAHQFGYPAQMDLSFGSANVASGATGFVQAASPLAFVALVAGVWAVQLWRRPPAAQEEGQAAWLATALLMAFVLANKVFSPQYLLWFGPLWVGLIAAMGQGRGGARRLWGPGGLLLGAALLSQVMYPRGYEVLKGFHPAMVAVLNVRNVLVLVLWGMLLWALGRVESPWRPK